MSVLRMIGRRPCRLPAASVWRGLQTGDQVAGVDAEGGGEPEDVEERHVALAPLDGAHIGTVQIAIGAELGLGHTEFEAARSNAAPELGHGIKTFSDH
jgi:hypothetical protein